MHEDATYDVKYDDGDEDTDLFAESIRPLIPSKISPSQLYVQERSKTMADVQSSFNYAQFRDRWFACEVEFLKRSSADWLGAVSPMPWSTCRWKCKFKAKFQIEFKQNAINHM